VPGQLQHDDAGRGRDAGDPVGVGSADLDGAGSDQSCGDALAGERRRQELGVRGADPGGAGRGGQLGHRAVGGQLPVVDDHDVVDGLGSLGQQVTGHQHRPALAGQLAQQVPHPPDPLGVQAVERFVENQHARVTEQGGGQRQPLPHAQ
jgi:hypothetical protein